MEDEPSYFNENALAALIGLAGAVLPTVLCVAILSELRYSSNNYGYALFIVVPIFAGFIAGLYAYRKGSSPINRIWPIALWIYGFVSIAMLVLSFEGIVCLIMALPIAYPSLVLGAYLGKLLRDQFKGNGTAMITTIPVLPVIAAGTCCYQQAPVRRIERTEIVVNASKEKIWPYLFNLNSLPEPQNWILRTGVAYPIRVEAMAAQVGSRRNCVLSTGNMPEVISAIEPYRRMRFDVLSTPAPLKETNPFGEVHAPHEHGYFDVEWGEFQLVDLGKGQTKLIGTSQYRFNLFPGWYWSLINDTVVEQIHARVMNEIKRRVEAANAQGH